ncbi:MAG: hypothetical protein ABR955_01870 [Verrucomicrobiota bacterium]|jgi:hypothetical protein
MSRPQKIIPPIKGGFNEILTAVALGKGRAKQVAPKVGEKVGAVRKKKTGKS